MTERIVGRPWSAEEDKLLKEAVEIHGEFDNWKTIALAVPGRTNKACRKRWLHSLSPTVKKTAWTHSEDQKLLEFYRLYGPRWSAIARQIPGRTDDACSKRYREALDPTLKKDEWTPEEDEKLLQVYARIGGKWGQVGQELNRSGLGCRNRWRLLERKKAAKAKQPEPPPPLIYNLAEQSPPPQPSPMEYVTHTPVVWETYYYPDEAYSFLQADDSTQNSISPEPPPCLLTPELYIDTQIPPSVISSFSCLENALSAPPPLSRPLPSVHEEHQPRHSSEPISSNLPSPPHSMDSGQMSQIVSPQMQPESEISLHAPITEQNFTYFYEENGMGFGMSDMYIQGPSHVEVIPGDPQLHDNSWKSPFSAEIDLLTRAIPNIYTGEDNTPDGSVRDDGPSSVVSTPLCLFSPVSLTSSPSIVTPVELPPSGNTPIESLLFSSSQSTATEKKKRKTSAKARKVIEDRGPTRLSSRLRLSSDPTVLPYACGYDRCWPADHEKSQFCFATSKELTEHSKLEHVNDDISDRPFRCGLASCGKSWKSINGLQYHLQVSTAHYRNALSSTFSKSAEVPPEPGPETEQSESEDSDKSKRTFVCTHPGCFKAYRQLSGLRYHRRHGHPQDMPVQLEVVPPTLARQIPAKTKKMRRKDVPSNSVAVT